MARTHLFTKKAEANLSAAKKRLAMARDSLEIWRQREAEAEQEVREAEYRLSLEREADDRSVKVS